jgi:hypothetical protein
MVVGAGGWVLWRPCSSTRRRSRQRLSAKDTPAWCAGARARVEARAALEQAEELRRVLVKLGEGGWWIRLLLAPAFARRFVGGA